MPGCVLDLAINQDIIKKSGSWFSYNDEKIAQGKENVRAYLEKNPDFYEEILAKVKETYMSNSTEITSDEDVDDEE